jgi:DNA polymerase-1
MQASMLARREQSPDEQGRPENQDRKGTPGKLVLVDGNSLVYRSFFAIPRLTNREGVPTNAAYGFATVLRKILSEEAPQHVAVVFDAGGKNFRHRLYPEYKAHRPPTPDDLSVQLPLTRDICNALGLPIVEIRAVEADDIVATLAARAEREGHRVFVVSSDKDFLQLVSQRITVISPGKEIRYDPALVVEKFGVPPDKVTDVLGLVGDSVDNVPGVPGIGMKGAVSLIREWGSIENVLENAQKIPNKRQREALLQHAEQARLSKKLVGLDTNVPLEIEPDALRYLGADRKAAFELFERLGFTSLLNDYLPETASTPPESCQPLASRAELKQLMARARTRGCLSLYLATAETKTSGGLLGVGLAVDSGQAFFVAMGGKWTEEAVVSELAPILSDRSMLKAGHDLKRTKLWFARRGVELCGIGFDAMVASYVLNPSKRMHDLETLSVEILQRPLSEPKSDVDKQEMLPGMVGAGLPTTVEDARPNAERAAAVLRIQERLEPRIDEEGLAMVFRELELPLIEVLADMERTGIRVDVDQLRAMSEEVGKDLEKLTTEIYELAGVEFNINSPKQLGEILFEKMNLPSFRKTQKQRSASTKMEVLEELAVHFELPRKILDYRSLAKLKGTYIDALPALVDPETGRIHTSFNQTVAATGRLSSSDPNLQNIPIRTELGQRIRAAFVAESGWLLLSADYSQIELRVLAHMSGDPNLIEAFRQDEDIHARTAKQVFGEDSGLSEAEQRRRAKIINFSIVYGKTAFTLGKEFGVPTREAQAFIDNYFDKYAKVRELLDKIVREAQLTGKVKTLFGRHRYVPEIGSRNHVTREAAKRVAVNAPIQGTAADLIKKAMVDLTRELTGRGLQSRLLLQVHDELVLEVPEREVEHASRLVREVMEGCYPLAVPLRVEVEVGPTWRH